MSLFAIVIPGGSFSCDADSPDQMLRDVTFCFGLYTVYSVYSDPQGGTWDDTIRRPGTGEGAFCARSGNFFPGSRLTRDGQGRKVGKPFKTDGPAFPKQEPWPEFWTN